MTPEELRRRRLAANLTQRELAEMVGTTANSLARWERGELGISGPAQRLLAIMLPDEAPPAEQQRGGRRRTE